MFDCLESVRDFCSKYRWCPQLAGLVAMLQGWGEAHGFPHTVRVLCRSLEIASELGSNVDLEVVVAGALLHDVGRGFEGELGRHHAVIGYMLAPLLLRAVGFPASKIEHVARVVLEHSYSAGGRPSTLESCIVGDADRLDALGAIGFYRLAETSAELSRPVTDALAHYWEKLERLPGLMCSGPGRRRAVELAERLEDIIEALRREVLAFEPAVAWLSASTAAQLSGEPLHANSRTPAKSQ